MSNSLQQLLLLGKILPQQAVIWIETKQKSRKVVRAANCFFNGISFKSDFQHMGCFSYQLKMFFVFCCLLLLICIQTVNLQQRSFASKSRPSCELLNFPIKIKCPQKIKLAQKCHEDSFKAKKHQYLTTFSHWKKNVSAIDS